MRGIPGTARLSIRPLRRLWNEIRTHAGHAAISPAKFETARSHEQIWKGDNSKVNEGECRQKLQEYGQEHVLRFWEQLSDSEKTQVLKEVSTIDFKLMKRLIEKWVLDEPDPESFDEILPVPLIPKADINRPDAKEAFDAGECALSAGRVGLFLVAGGQGTRLGFPGPKGAYPVGPITKKSLFEYHAEKIHNTQNKYGCVLPWYIMVSAANDAPTRQFFKENAFFGLDEKDVFFFQQRMVPCVDEGGKFMLETPCHLAMNPNGHGGSLPAMVDNGVTSDAKQRGVDCLSYFQVDNWTVKVADPYFIGYHVLRNAEMSSKNHLKNDPREAVGVHCLCDGVYHVIEYSELDIYPQLLELDENGAVIFGAGNPAIHIISTDFVERVCEDYDKFPWHKAHKRIARVNGSGDTVKPDEPNGYKFETFVFDALRFIRHEPVAFEIERRGEFSPIKQYDGVDSVTESWASMGEYWGEWLEASGATVPRDENGVVSVNIEISPQFALSKEEFLEKSAGRQWLVDTDIAIGADGNVIG